LPSFRSSSSCAHRALHPFPTRRSSDLRSPALVAMPRYRVLIADNMSAEGLAPLARDSRFELVQMNGLKGEELARAIEPCDAVIVDRKSTRLNSSHVKISYAVFCLKKKK